MEFWGVEVKSGKVVKVDPDEFEESIIHVSQSALGEAKKKGKENDSSPTVLYLKFGNKKFVLGTLFRDKIPQICHDLVLEKKFELSHNSKTDSVYFCGYKALCNAEEDSDTDSDEEESPPKLRVDHEKKRINDSASESSVSANK